MQSIGIDCRFAGTHSGLGRYTRELVSALLGRRDGIHYVLFVRSGDEAWLKRDFGSSVTVNVFDCDHYSLSEQLRFPGVIRAAGIDLLFSPHFNVPLLSCAPVVVTAHDLILHRYPNDAQFFKQLAYRALFRRAITKAERVIAVSAFTAKELSSVYGRSVTRKLSVIHEAVSPHFSKRHPLDCAEILRKYNLTQPYFLYVGNAKEHKNVKMLLVAFAALNDPAKQLVLVTDGKELAALHPGPGVRVLKNVPEDDLPFLYSSARCFVSPSLYEGFGLPLLEAHACGCPGIVLNRSSYPEIAPPGTALIDTSVEAMAAALASPPAWQGPSTTRTWADVAAETAALFLDVLKRV